MKLKPYIVTEETLQYLRALWKEIAEQFFQLPDLDAVLHDIQEGSVVVSWLISDTVNAATQIKSRVQVCAEFFSKWQIVLLMVNKECIYHELEQETQSTTVQCFDDEEDTVSQTEVCRVLYTERKFFIIMCFCQYFLIASTH